MRRAHNVIIVTTGASAFAESGSLDKLIRKVLSLNKNPILVLGPDGDVFLQTCHLIEECDLVFDPNYQGNFFSGVKAGLHATNGAAFVLPLLPELPDDSIWLQLESALSWPDEGPEFDLIRPMSHCDDALGSFPQLVTPHGIRTLLNLAATTRWEQATQFKARLVPVALHEA